MRQLLARLLNAYPVAGRWGSPTAVLDHTPKDTRFAGQLVIERRAGELTRLDSCGAGVEVPIVVGLRTDEGALSEMVDATALLVEQGSQLTVDGRPVPFLAHETAPFDLSALSGSFAFADDPIWTYGRATLRADITSFGTRGRLLAGALLREPLDDPSINAAPADEEGLLRWPTGDNACEQDSGSSQQAIYPAPTDATRELLEAIDQAAAQTYRAKYANGTETKISVQVDAPTDFCSGSYGGLPTRARLSTDDGRLDVSVDVLLQPSYALLHFNENTNGPWAHLPSQVESRIGQIDAELTGQAHVGVEAWFDLTPEPRGRLRVLGFAEGQCGVCNTESSCIECGTQSADEVLTLFIGSQADAN